MNRHEIGFPLHPPDLDSVVRSFKALADATRVELMLRLSTREQNVRELVEALRAPQSTVSRHLGVLRAAELVTTRRDGTSVYYRLSDAHIGDLVKEAFSHTEHGRLGLPDHSAEGVAPLRPTDSDGATSR